MIEPIVNRVDPNTFEYQDYSNADITLIDSSSFDTAFTQSTDYIELYIYNEDQDKIYPTTTFELKDYQVRDGDILLNPTANIEEAGLEPGRYFTYYNFFRRHLNSSVNEKYYIDEISPSRTEIRLKSNKLSDSAIFDSAQAFQSYRESQPYFVDFYLNFGDNQQVIANNITTTPATDIDPVTVLIKLYEPLPTDFELKAQCWITEEISEPLAYSVEVPFEEITDVTSSAVNLKGPNFNINIAQQVGISSEKVNYNQLVNTTNTSSLQQLRSLLDEKGINININYENRNEFIKFSSAEERLANFYYKVSLIEQTQNTLSSSIYNITGDTTGSNSYSSSKASLESIINSTIENFDSYEYFLYYNSGSSASWPKSSSTLPYILYPTGSTEVLNWYGSKNENSIYFGGQIYSASLYDEDNPDWLYKTIPEYLLEDPDNAQYELFIDMIGQHFDNVWTYTKDVTNKFNADNRLDYGISKDLVADAIREFGVKLYSNNYDKDDLFQAFLGIRADGGTFPIANITSSLPVPSGSGLDYVTNEVTASSDIIAQNDVLKSIYKRIYHNLPYLLKTKGTLQGIRTLVNTFGIPDTIMQVQEYSSGRQPRTSQIPRYQQSENIYNYYLDYSGTQAVETGWELHPSWSAAANRPETLIFRFKPETLNSQSAGPTNISQTLFSLDNGPVLNLEYTGSVGISGSWSGSIVNPEYQFSTLKFFPEGTANPSASVYLPFHNGDWWSVMINYQFGDGYTLTAKNKFFDGVTQQAVAYTGINSIQLTGSDSWASASTATFGVGSAPALFFSGGLQEIRYYTSQIPESVFNDYAVNPVSFEGSGVNLAPEELAFRATLGSELYTGSISVHPQVSGSWRV